MKKTFLISIIGLFIVLSIGLYFLCTSMPEFKYPALEIANSIMLVLGLLAYTMINKPKGATTGAFVRGVTGVSFLRLMVSMVAILGYVMVNKEHIHKPTVFTLMGIYAMYTTIETVLLSKLAREQK